jgi:hypothetical protein
VDVMDNVVYTAISRYFSMLSKFGYVNYDKVYNILYLILIRDFVYNDFYGYITEDDYRHIERSLYCLFGKSCLIPYPEYLTMNNLNLGSISELAYMMKKNKEDISKVIDNINEIKKTRVIKGDLNGEEIPNIDISKSIK